MRTIMKDFLSNIRKYNKNITIPAYGLMGILLLAVVGFVYSFFRWFVSLVF